MKQNIINRNQKGQWHGYQERYANTFHWDGLYEFHPGDIIEIRGVYYNDWPVGYEEWHIGVRMSSYYIK